MVNKLGIDIPHNMIAFVNDPVSEQIMLNTIRDMSLAYSEVKIGKIDDMVDFLKNNRTPKILIADISDSELPLSDIVKLKECASPSINIIAVGSRNDVGLFRDLMDIGISDYLVKPLNNALLKKAIDDINTGNKDHEEKTGKLIYVMSSVGGAGATTISSNISWILANRHFKRAVLMDMDFMFGTANLMFDIKAESSYLDLMESPDKIDEYFIDTILKKYSQRLYYLGGLVDLVRGNTMSDHEAFEALTLSVKKQFNYVLVDSQRNLDIANKIAMKNTDSFVILIEMSLASAQNTVRLLEFLNTEHTGKKVLIIANKIGLSSGGALSKESFEKAIDRKINYILPFDDKQTLAAANIGQPLASSPGALTDLLEDITDDILGKKETQNIAMALLKKEGLTFKRIKNFILESIEKYIK